MAQIQTHTENKTKSSNAIPLGKNGVSSMRLLRPLECSSYYAFRWSVQFESSAVSFGDRDAASSLTEHVLQCNYIKAHTPDYGLIKSRVACDGGTLWFFCFWSRSWVAMRQMYGTVCFDYILGQEISLNAAVLHVNYKWLLNVPLLVSSLQFICLV